MNPGPRTREQLSRLAAEWRQGEHLFICGGTGCGKTELARHIDQIRLDKGGFVMVFVGKLNPDDTILKEYKGWTRWDTFKKRPSPSENRVLLWPRTDKAKTIKQARAMQRAEFGYAMDQLMQQGKWTVHIDEGLYTCDPKFLNLSDELAMLHAQGRSGKLTLITLAQRPSNLPLIVYGSMSHAFVSRAKERSDNIRLAELGGKESAKELSRRIEAGGKHDFIWIPADPDKEPESVNLAR